VHGEELHSSDEGGEEIERIECEWEYLGWRFGEAAKDTYNG
jgi:hypothetical protein